MREQRVFVLPVGTTYIGPYHRAGKERRSEQALMNYRSDTTLHFQSLANQYFAAKNELAH